MFLGLNFTLHMHTPIYKYRKSPLGSMVNACFWRNYLPQMYRQTCPTAAGAFFHGDWLYHSFVLEIPEVRNLHINFKEVLAIILAAKRWGKLWCNKHVIIQSDNSTALSIVNKGTTGNPIIMRYLRELFWLSAVYNFRITAIYLPGCMNYIADAISRMHEPYCIFKTLGYPLPFYCGYYTLLFDCPLLAFSAMVFYILGTLAQAWLSNLTKKYFFMDLIHFQRIPGPHIRLI